MKIVIVIFVMFLTCTKVFSMCDSNKCGTIARGPDRGDGAITYSKVTITGETFTVERQEKDGIECFSGSEGHIYRQSNNKLGNNASKRIWHEIHNDYEDWMKILEKIRNELKNQKK